MHQCGLLSLLPPLAPFFAIWITGCDFSVVMRLIPCRSVFASVFNSSIWLIYNVIIVKEAASANKQIGMHGLVTVVACATVISIGMVTLYFYAVLEKSIWKLMLWSAVLLLCITAFMTSIFLPLDHLSTGFLSWIIIIAVIRLDCDDEMQMARLNWRYAAFQIGQTMLNIVVYSFSAVCASQMLEKDIYSIVRNGIGAAMLGVNLIILLMQVFRRGN